jgi:hypothetical protein
MAAPANTSAPVITGTIEVGQTLSVSTGTWSGTPTSYTYAWYLDGVAIAGVTATTYLVTTVAILKSITAIVTAINGDGSAAASSAATIVVPSTLIPETGGIVANADCYGTLSMAAAYHAAMGNDAWALATYAKQEQAMRKGTVYVDGKFFYRFKGSMVKPTTQSLQFPRVGVQLAEQQDYLGVSPSFYDMAYAGYLPSDIVPAGIIRASFEAALIALDGDLAPALERGGLVINQTVGPVSQTFSDKAPASTKYESILLHLIPFLKVGGLISLVRS